MKTTQLLSIVIGSILLSSCFDDGKTTFQTPNIPTPDGYSLVWSDEFSDPLLDIGRWQYETGDGTDYGLPVGWGNDEKQIYTVSAENSGITKSDGEMAFFIRANKTASGGYTSAKLTSKNFSSIRFGRIDIRAKMPQGQGIWPAIWMLGDNIDEIKWPGCGEIDIAEVLGHEPKKMYATLHYTDVDNRHGETQKNHILSDSSFADAFHIFSIDWDHQKMRFYVDGTEIQQVAITADMKEFLRSFYLIFNVAVGGNWPGDPNDETVFPQTMYIDYVRVYEKNGYDAPDAPKLNIDEETIGQNIDPSVMNHAIKEGFTDLGNGTVVVFGGGGEPTVKTSEEAVDGAMSLVFDFPGGHWGGGYIELESPVDLSAYTSLKFSLYKPSELVNAEIKLESPKTNATVYLKDYTGADVGKGFVEYTIPFADFTDLDVSEIKIPFSMWNPQDASDAFVTAEVLIDNLHFSK